VSPHKTGLTSCPFGVPIILKKCVKKQKSNNIIKQKGNSTTGIKSEMLFPFLRRLNLTASGETAIKSIKFETFLELKVA